MSHRHHCCVTGHDFQCSDDCTCICGLPMEGNDHSDCPVELRPCRKHKDKTEPQMTAVESTAVEIDVTSLCQKREHPRFHCKCGCADVDRRNVAGWCLWCDHAYVEYSPKIEARHFAHDCPGAPEKLKQASLARLAQRKK